MPPLNARETFLLEQIVSTAKELSVRQRKELAELVGFETRNKYEIQDGSGTAIGFAAEQGKGFSQAFGRHFLGHWREFEVHVFNNHRGLAMKLWHPFRWFFQRIEVSDANGTPLGAMEKRLTLLNIRFDIEDARQGILMEVHRPFWTPWT